MSIDADLTAAVARLAREGGDPSVVIVPPPTCIALWWIRDGLCPTCGYPDLQRGGHVCPRGNHWRRRLLEWNRRVRLGLAEREAAR